MGWATDSGEGVLGMESDYHVLSQKRRLYWRAVCTSSGGNQPVWEA